MVKERHAPGRGERAQQVALRKNTAGGETRSRDSVSKHNQAPKAVLPMAKKSPSDESILSKGTAQIRLKKLAEFDANGLAPAAGNLFGLPFSTEESDIVIVPATWDVTVSFGAGTASGPQTVLEASHQVDLDDSEYPGVWRLGIAMDEVPTEILKKSGALAVKAKSYIKELSRGKHPSKSKEQKSVLELINKGSNELNTWVKQQTGEFLKSGKMVGLLGGEHSVDFGFLEALSERHENFGILQIDAHMDLREAYEGFEYSHASAMHNALKLKQVGKLVQVGVRDYCEAESGCVRDSNGRVVAHTDAAIRKQVYNGTPWGVVCERIIRDLPKEVFISFDIDGLDPALCPNTGTPVPGGLQFQEATYLINTLVNSGRVIIGFDLVEVAPNSGNLENDWDSNVGARILYKLCGAMAKSRGRP